ncbi:MAG: HAD-IC family P-type ATPase, partial [Myxococcales bacterium]
CVDKTGTLTRGSFALEALLPLGGASEDELLQTAALACELEPVDPMERAIVERGGSQPLHWQLVEDYPFEPAGKHMTHLWRRGAEFRVAAKGALEGILEHCTGADREQAHAGNERLAGAGMRVLAVAGRSATARGADRSADEADLQLLGLLGFRDPLRPEVPAAVAECKAAGIAVKMITGDHALTARAIAAAAGLPCETVLTGVQLEAIPPEELPDALRRTSVLARVRPEQKHAVVEALLSTGEVVAMTGDGINDAPALRRADIGVAMGQRGTAVARAAADLVLLHDDFGALVATIREGRRIFANLQRAFLYLVAFHIPIVGLAVLPPLLGLPMLLLPVHLVWLELLVHPISALVFEGEPAPPGAMTRPPRDPKAPLLPRPLLVRSAVSGALITLFALALFAFRLRDGETTARSLAVTTVIAGSLLLVFAERALDAGWREAGLPRERRFWLVWLLSAATLPTALWIAPVAQILRIQPLSLTDFALATAASALAVVWRAPARSLK